MRIKVRAMHQNIVKKKKDELMYKRLEYSVHQGLKRGGGVHEVEWHG